MNTTTITRRKPFVPPKRSRLDRLRSRLSYLDHLSACGVATEGEEDEACAVRLKILAEEGAP